MKPISNQNFGNLAGKIKMTYHNGTAVVDGYIVKQIGTGRFVCAPLANSTTQSTVVLASTTPAATTLTPGYGTIKGSTFGSNAVEYVSVIRGATCVTTGGVSYSWNIGGASKPGNLGLSSII
jgi:hypothetical protein